MMYGNDFYGYNDIAYAEWERSLEEAENDDNVSYETEQEEEEMRQIVEDLEFMRNATLDEYGMYIGYNPGEFTEEEREEARETLTADLNRLMNYYEGSERRLIREVFESEKVYNRYK